MYQVCLISTKMETKGRLLFDKMFNHIEQALGYMQDVKNHSVWLKIELRQHFENDGYKVLMSI